MKTALLVIDMINDYLHSDGLLYCERCREIIPNIKKTIEFAHQNNILVIYVNTGLESKNDILAKKWGLHAVADSYGAQIIDEFSPSEGDLIVHKKGYNGFFNTTLDKELKRRSIENIAISGIHTHVCVLLTAVGGFELGYNVTVLEDCITTDSASIRGSELNFFNTHIGELSSLNEWKGKYHIKII